MSFNSTLVSWYSENKRDLALAKTPRHPYNIWLSEIILQQTQVKQGLPYYEKFISNFSKHFMTWLVPLKLEILKTLARTRLLLKSKKSSLFSKIYYKRTFGWSVPTKPKRNFCYLKGVGDYTASAIASICYEEAVAVVDGNVYRVLARYFGSGHTN